MGVRITSHDEAVLYCSTTDWAFGPVFYGDDEHTADEHADMFVTWLGRDARSLDDGELERKYIEWRGVHDRETEERDQDELNPIDPEVNG